MQAWLEARMREKTTWMGLVVMAALVWQINPDDVVLVAEIVAGVVGANAIMNKD